MDHYSRMDLEDFVVPNYQDTSVSYPSLDLWSEWSMNSQKAVDKCFDFDVISNGFSGGSYSQMDMEIGKNGEVIEDENESKRFKKDSDCFYHSTSSLLHDFNGIQQMDDIFLSSILEDVPGNENLDTFDGGEVPMFHYNWEASQDMHLMEKDELMKISDLCEENIGEPSSEEVVLQDLQRASEKLTDDTRKCFRDTFYRLAKNSQQKSESKKTNSHNRTSRNIYQEDELETNSIDRAIANLTFNKMESNMRNLPPSKKSLF